MSRLKNTLIGVAVVAAFLAGMWWFSKPTQTPVLSANAGPSGELSAVEEFYDFGTVSMAAGKVSHELKIKNIKNDPVTISNLYTSCMCTEAEFVMGDIKKGPFGMPGHGFSPSITQVIAPGQEAVIRAIFDPAAHGPAGVGPIEREVTIEQKSGQKLSLKFKAVVTP